MESFDESFLTFGMVLICVNSLKETDFDGRELG